MVEASKPAKSPRKFNRSTSPRAVELRRLQNRLSQRKHRLKIREAREGENSQDNSSANLEPSSVTTTENPPDSPHYSLVDINASLTESEQLAALESGASPLTATTSIMVDDLLQNDTAWPRIDSMMSFRPSLEHDRTVLQSIGTSAESSPANTSSSGCTCNSIAGPCSSHVEKLRAQILAETNDLQIPNDPIADDITPRFGIILECIQQAGFQDVEEMMLAYYTSRFERGSFPAMAQCVSRKHRLKSMLLNLQKNSDQWPRWESRGLHESVSDSIVSLCVNDTERATTSVPGLPRPTQNDTANLVSALEWLLRDQGCGMQSYPRPGNDEKLEGLVDNAPDKMPHLWNLLANLTGVHGLYCDRIARILLAIILHARRAMPATDTDKFGSMR